jgi:NAD(P)-dependent dehydrogenase (short-subunit alcohol dehydrogenase family)
MNISSFNSSPSNVKKAFDLTNKIAIITGGAGLLGIKHAEAIIEMGGTPILLDINEDLVQKSSIDLSKKYNSESYGICCDITSEKLLQETKSNIIRKFGQIDILINNAANNPKVEESTLNFSRLENFPIETWQKDIAVGLTGAFLCSRVFGSTMVQTGGGVILNIASDLALIAPDQRIYMKDELDWKSQPVKPVTYSVVKSGLLGLTRYIATYWTKKGVRCNALLPGGVYTNQEQEFVTKLENLIPMERMANQNDYKGAIAFLCSDASAYMTGAFLSIDGGRTCW